MQGIRKTDPQYQEVLSRGKLWPILFGITAPVVSVAAGVVKLYGPHHRIDTEAEAATDDVDTFLGVQDGKVYLVRPADDARTIVLKHGTGNIYTTGGSDITLSSENDIAFFIYVRTLDKCIAWSFGAAGGAGVDHGLLGGLADDDHPQYLTPAEHTSVGDGAPHHAELTDHGALSGLADDDHPQYQTPAEHAAIGDGSPHHVKYTDAQAIAAVSIDHPKLHDHDATGYISFGDLQSHSFEPT